MHDWMWGHGPMGWGGGMMFLASLFWLAAFTLILLAIARLWPSSTFRSATPPEDEALSILRKRYASGEIDHEEYEQRRRNLTSG